MLIFTCCFSKKTITQELLDISYKNTIPFVPPIRGGKVIKVYDGDTITIAAKLPYKGSPIYRFSIRLNGIDSPEIKGKTAEEKRLAIAARDALCDLIFGEMVILRNCGTEKYGRLLADVYFINKERHEVYINQWMLDNKYAIPYSGGTKISYK
jgi:endonuclease YncB( thermonuclease family)